MQFSTLLLQISNFNKFLILTKIFRVHYQER